MLVLAASGGDLVHLASKAWLTSRSRTLVRRGHGLQTPVQSIFVVLLSLAVATVALWIDCPAPFYRHVRSSRHVAPEAEWIAMLLDGHRALYPLLKDCLDAVQEDPLVAAGLGG